MRICVVGAGVVGRLIAMRFMMMGVHVVLFDAPKKDKKNASMIAAGMLSPFCELTYAAKNIYHLGISALPLWKDIADVLKMPQMLSLKGTLVLAHYRDFQELEKFKQRIEFYLKEVACNLIGADEIQALEPELYQRFSKGFFLNQEGCIDPDLFFRATDDFLKTSDLCEFIEYEITEYFLKWAEVQKIKYDYVIDCRGFGSHDVLNHLRPVRGEVIHVQHDAIQFNRPIRLMHPRYPLYVVPRYDQTYVVGTTHIETDSLEPITVQSVMELLSALCVIHPDFLSARILHMHVGLRPTFSSHEPRIVVRENIIHVNGMFRHGFLIGPKIADVVLHYVMSGEKNYSDLFEYI